MVLIQAEIIVVEAEINVEAPVAVIIGCGSMRERPLRSIHKVEGIAFLLKLSISLIHEQHRPGGADYQKVLEPFILKICKERRSCPVQHPDSGGLRDILKSSITAIPVQPVGKSRGLADIEIIQTVVVEVSRSQSGISVNVHCGRAVQNRAPVVHPMEHLIFVGISLAEGLRSYIEENGLWCAAESFFSRGPTEGSPATSIVVRPFRQPIPNALLESGVPVLAHKVVANVDTNV